MSTIHAETACELCAKLESIEDTVPLRPEGRKSKHMEIWTSCRVLATISRTSLLEYPLVVKHDDRPDFVLSLPSTFIGMEITEAVFQDQARVEAFSDRQNITDMQHVPSYKDGESLRSRAEIEEIARGGVKSSTRSPASTKRGWIEAIFMRVERKAETFKKPEFRHFATNWLLVYDNLATFLLPTDECDVSAKLSTKMFNNSWDNPFDRIFVLRSENIWQFGKWEAPIRHSISDYWRNSSLNS